MIISHPLENVLRNAFGWLSAHAFIDRIRSHGPFSTARILPSVTARCAQSARGGGEDRRARIVVVCDELLVVQSARYYLDAIAARVATANIFDGWGSQYLPKLDKLFGCGFAVPFPQKRQWRWMLRDQIPEHICGSVSECVSILALLQVLQEMLPAHMQVYSAD